MKKLISLVIVGILLSVMPTASKAVDCGALDSQINSGVNTRTVSQQCSIIRTKSDDILTCSENQSFVFYPNAVAQATIDVCNFYKNNPDNFYTEQCKNVIITASGTQNTSGGPSSTDCFVGTVNFIGAPKECKDALDAISEGVQDGNTVLEQCTDVILKPPVSSAMNNSECTSRGVPFDTQTAKDIKTLCNHYANNPDSERTKKCGGEEVSFDNNSEAAKCNRDTLTWLTSCPGGRTLRDGAPPDGIKKQKK